MKHVMKKSCIAVLLAAVMMFGAALSAFAAEASVKADGTRIRSDSSTDSAVVTTAAGGTTYTVLDTVTGSDGNTWYKVQVSDGQTGFVRGDLVNVSGEASDSAPEEVTSSAPTTPIQPMNVTTKETANIRSGAGTDYSRVGKIESGTEIQITGEAMASDGYKWYEMNCESKGVSGFIRSDFVEIDESAVVYSTGSEEPAENPEGEEAPAEEDQSAPADEEHKDYEIVYAPDDDGVYQYYLYNHIDSTKQKVESLLEMVNTLNDKYKEANKKLSTFKVLTILFGILTVVAAGLAVFFFLRSRADYEYYEEDFPEPQKEPAKKRPADPDRDRERPQRKSAPSDQGERERPRRNPDRPAQEGREGRRSEERPSEKSRPESRREDGERPSEKRRPAPEQGEERPQRKPRRPQNFLANDDDLEFEFLDMDE